MSAPRRIPFDRIAETYDDSRALVAESVPTLTAALSRELTGRRTIEVGVGTGRIAALLDASGVPLVGADLSMPMLRRAREKGLARAVRADATHLPFADACFEFATTNHLLHLLPDWPLALREISRVASREYLTILEIPDPQPGAPRPRREYDRALRELGVEIAPLGLHEWKLAQRLPPDRWVEIGAFTERTSVGEIVAGLEQRLWSAQWRVPEAAHRVAMEHVRREFAEDAPIVVPTRVRVAFWSIPRLEAFAIGRLDGAGTRPGTSG